MTSKYKVEQGLGNTQIWFVKVFSGRYWRYALHPETSKILSFRSEAEAQEWLASK